LAEALALPRLQGLRGLFLSGAGPTVLALADNHFAALGEAVAACFTRHNLTSTVRLLAVDAKGAEFLCQ
jgi:homoserine kinase